MNIKSKLISIFTFHQVDKKILEDADMAGPLLVLILFGFTLALVYLYIKNKSKQKRILVIFMVYQFLEVL